MPCRGGLGENYDSLLLLLVLLKAMWQPQTSKSTIEHVRVAIACTSVRRSLRGMVVSRVREEEGSCGTSASMNSMPFSGYGSLLCDRRSFEAMVIR
jgi:hypothetical protein